MITRLHPRNRLKRHLRGEGIEIGALHNPLDLRGLPISRISYVDRLSVEDLRIHYPELNQVNLVPVDIIDDGSTLSTIPDHSLDFIIANQLIEHMSNPIRALRNWSARLKPGGVLFLGVPDKRYTFDRDRGLTTLQHLLDDFYATEEHRTQRDFYHFVETVEIVMKLHGKDNEDRVNDLINRQYSIHYHTWTFFSFRDFLRCVTSEMGIPFQVIDYSMSFPWIKEFIFILKKPEI